MLSAVEGFGGKRGRSSEEILKWVFVTIWLIKPLLTFWYVTHVCVYNSACDHVSTVLKNRTTEVLLLLTARYIKRKAFVVGINSLHGSYLAGHTYSVFSSSCKDSIRERALCRVLVVANTEFYGKVLNRIRIISCLLSRGGKGGNYRVIQKQPKGYYWHFTLTETVSQSCSQS
jgi:hypothetical protein